MVLRLRQPAPGLWKKAKCLGMVKKEPGKPLDDPFFEGPEEDAIKICRACPECPIMKECLLFALVNNEKHGVWGGHGESDRKAIRKQWPLRRGKQPRPEWDVFEPGEPTGWFEELPDEEDDDDE